MPKGHTVRFLVADDYGRTSSTWRVWTNGRSGDVYFGHREAAGEIKGSLHESGAWQYGMTSTRVRSAANVRGWDGKSRHIMRWRRPAEMAPGLTLAVEFGFPTTELQVLPNVTLDGCIVLPAAGADEAVLVALFFAKPGAYLGGRWPGEDDMSSEYVADFPLPSGERVYLVRTIFAVPSITRADLADKRREFSYMRDTADRRARFGSIVENSDGSRLFIDAAVRPDRIELPFRRP